MKKLLLIIGFLCFNMSNANSISIQVTDATEFITVTIDSVVRWTIPKREQAIEIIGTVIRLRYAEKYVVSFQFSDVTSPATANIEALRVAINNMLITP
jgi:hypothetical protein